MPKMTEPEIHAHLPAAKGWDRLGDMLVRTWQFASSRRCPGIRQSSRRHRRQRWATTPTSSSATATVRIELSTHAEGGLTARDFEMAPSSTALPIDRATDLAT